MENEEPEALEVPESNMEKTKTRRKTAKLKRKPAAIKVVLPNENHLVYDNEEHKQTDDVHGWIQLYSGRKLFPLKPRVEDIDIEDIAHSLSNMCRFTGHVKYFYSVAQHSVLVSYLCDKEHALYGLLHDATEAYLVDMPKPIKRLETFSNFREIENNIMGVIAKKFGLPQVEPRIVKEADIKMLATEARDLMSPLHPDWVQPCQPYPFKIEPLNPAEAKELFLSRYRELTNG